LKSQRVACMQIQTMACHVRGSVALAAAFNVFIAHGITWSHQRIEYASEDTSRQWLNIYLADTSNGPTPVLFYAHQNGGSADSFGSRSAGLVTGAGYSVVSWESLTSISTPSHIAIGWADAQLAFDWVQANAATYNLDPSHIVVAGRSRGSVISWRLGHSGHEAIKGFYVYNALPDGVWRSTSTWNPVNDVSTDSPPLYFAYGPAPNDGDSHNPVNVYPVLERYNSMGMEDRVSISEDMNAAQQDPFHFFPDFVATLGENRSVGEPGNSSTPVSISARANRLTQSLGCCLTLITLL